MTVEADSSTTVVMTTMNQQKKNASRTQSPAQDVELRVTLSYYIEPNPGERGQSNRFSYASHGLRFAVQRREETEVAFQRRINQLARDSEDGIPVTSGGALANIASYQ